MIIRIFTSAPPVDPRKGWRPNLTGFSSEIQWLPKRYAVPPDADFAGRSGTWKPWLTAPVSLQDGLAWHVAQRPGTAEGELLARPPKWTPWLGEVSREVQWLAKAQQAIFADAAPPKSPTWQPWLTASVVTPVDSLPWLAQHRVTAPELEQFGRSLTWKPWLTAPVVTPVDSLPWLAARRLNPEEIQQLGRPLTWTPWLTAPVVVADSLPWRAVPHPRYLFEIGRSLSAAWTMPWNSPQPPPPPPIDSLPWRFVAHPNYPQIIGPSLSTAWGMPWNSPQPGPPPPPIVIRPIGFAVSASPVGNAVAGSPEATVN